MSNPDPPQPASSAATIAAETPQPFPSLPTPTPSNPAPTPSVLAPTPAPPARDAPPPAPVDVAVSGGAAAFPDQAQVRWALDRLEQLDLSDVAVSVDGGTATIEGSVPRGVDRDRITTALGQLAGVTEVRDRLRIRTA
ncbi:MAG: BON domain-containing protein [Myxococcales bacterium]|nr:BON domain-containing protein [Myxococcales bacterium]